MYISFTICYTCKVEKIPLSTINYPIRKKLKRIPLDVAKEKYDQIKSAAETTGESVNGYIKKAIDERMERDNLSPAASETP